MFGPSPLLWCSVGAPVDLPFSSRQMQWEMCTISTCLCRCSSRWVSRNFPISVLLPPPLLPLLLLLPMLVTTLIAGVGEEEVLLMSPWRVLQALCRVVGKEGITQTSSRLAFQPRESRRCVWESWILHCWSTTTTTTMTTTAAILKRRRGGSKSCTAQRSALGELLLTSLYIESPYHTVLYHTIPSALSSEKKVEVDDCILIREVFDWKEKERKRSRRRRRSREVKEVFVCICPLSFFLFIVYLDVVKKI